MLQLANRLSDFMLGRIKENQESQENHSNFTMLSDAVNRPEVSVSYPQNAETLAAELFKPLLNPPFHPRDLHRRPFASFNLGAHRKHVLQSAFGHHEISIVFRHQYAESLPNKIIRHLTQLLVPRHVEIACANRFIDWICESRLIRSVQISVKLHLPAWMST